ncbi:signal peptide protein [Rhodopirellula maiorica SM1]|uniref:Signal peptide protein n=1 Tax=Rhodopirellula maiorica SM1 TaxID=1265738 RepID=M5RVD8_9BACT|nr:hypothetical protein [Rhodopirellula maiorica]EMI19352.1 signal peptide protein [Rhodopirellula maiorica SM1]
MKMLSQSTWSLLATGMLLAGFTIVGCDNKETLLDVDTPDGGVEVERSLDTGEVTVDVDE